MSGSSVKKLLLILVVGSFVLFLGGLGIGMWIARNKVASEEAEVNRRLANQSASKFQMLNVDTNKSPIATQLPSNGVQQANGTNSFTVLPAE